MSCTPYSFNGSSTSRRRGESTGSGRLWWSTMTGWRGTGLLSRNRMGSLTSTAVPLRKADGDWSHCNNG